MTKKITELLNSFTKSKLLLLAEFFREERISRSTKKTDMVRYLSELFGNNVRSWLAMFSERDLLLLQALSRADEGEWISFEYPDFLSFVEVLGLAETDKDSLNTLRLRLEPAIRVLIAPYIDDVIQEMEDEGMFTLGRLGLGILNTYGVIDFDDYMSIFFNCLDDLHFPASFFEKHMGYVDPIVRYSQFDYKKIHYISSPYINHPADILKQRSDYRRECRKQGSYSCEYYIEAGRNHPYCVWGRDTREYKQLVAMLTGLGYDDRHIMSLLHEIWIAAQYVGSEASEEIMFHSVSELMEAIPTFEQYKDCIDTIADYANAIPKWVFNGNSANACGTLLVKVNVSKVEEDDDEVAEEDFIDDMVDSDEKSSSAFAIPEQIQPYFSVSNAIVSAAADDPCPCGSGHPYRLCHGRFRN